MAKKKKAKRSKTTQSRKNRDVLVVASKIKAYVREQGLNTSGETINCLSNKMYAILDEAAARTSANGRKTLKPQDV